LPRPKAAEDLDGDDGGVYNPSLNGYSVDSPAGFTGGYVKSDDDV
jgi:hypothetical protein